MFKIHLVKILVIFCFYSLEVSAQNVEKLANTFGTLPEISDVKLSPDGTKLLLMQNHQGRKILVTRSLIDPSLPQNGLPYPDGEFNWAEWISNDRIVAGVRFEQKVDVAQQNSAIYNVELTLTRLVSMNWDGENAFNPVPLVNRRLQPQFQSTVLDFLENDPEHILIQLDVNEINDPGVHMININTKSKRFVTKFKGRRAIKYWQTDRNHDVRFGRGTTNNRRSLKVRDVAFYRKTKDSPWFELYDVDLNKEDRPFSFVAFSDEPNVVYILKTSENGKTSLFTYDVDRETTINKISASDDNDVIYVHLDDNGTPDWYRYNGEKPGIVYLTEYGKKLDAVFKKNFPNLFVSIYTKSKDGSKVIFKTSAPKEPGTFYLFDLEDRKMEMLGYNYKEVDVESLTSKDPISYQARDGLSIPGYLSLPKVENAKNLPTVIFPHWGPKHHDAWGFDYVAQFLTAQGYAVLQMNYRGSTGYGKEYTRLGDHQWGNKMLEDINDGTKWMIEQGYADPNNICILGDTYGGYAALQAIVKDESLYKCSIAHAPITNLTTYRETRRDFTNYRETMNYIESDDYTLTEASPGNNVDKINIPILIMHSKNDTRVKVRQSEGFYSRMTSAGKNIKFINWEEGNNYLSGQLQRVDFLKQTGLFLEQHLKQN